VKEQFEVGEKILFSFSLRNNGQQDVAVDGALLIGWDIYLEITGPDGAKVRSCGGIPVIRARDGKLAIIHPGEVRKANRDIRCDEEEGISGYSIKEPGKYRVVARYYTAGELEYLERKASAATVVKGPFKAEPVEFWLVPTNAAKDASE